MEKQWFETIVQNDCKNPFWVSHVKNTVRMENMSIVLKILQDTQLGSTMNILFRKQGRSSSSIIDPICFLLLIICTHVSIILYKILLVLSNDVSLPPVFGKPS
jgi:hypothetical protein